MKPRTLKNLKAYIEMMWLEEYKSGHYKLAADLRRLLEFLENTKASDNE